MPREMKIRRSIYLVPFLGFIGAAFLSTQAAAQSDTTFRDATIEIIQTYKPEVKETAKPEWAAELPTLDTQKARLSFEVPQQALSYTYPAMPIRPLSLNRDSLERSYQDYLKFGLGNLRSKMLSASVSRFSGPGFQSNIQLHHHSLRGSIPHQHGSRTALRAALNTQQTRSPWEAILDLQHDRYGQYGYDHTQLDLPRDSTLTAYTGLGLHIGTENLLGGRFGLEDAPSLSLNFYRTRNGRSEAGIQTSLPVRYKINASFQLDAAVYASLLGYDGHGNHLFAFRPRVHWKHSSMQAWIGLYPTVGMKGGYLLPDLYFQFRPSHRLFQIDLGYHSEIRRNRFEDMTRLNPYLSEQYIPIQSRVNEVFTEAQLHLGHHLQLGVRGSIYYYDYLPLLQRTGGGGRLFEPVGFRHARARAISVTGRYQIGHLFSVGLLQEWVFFDRIQDHKPWHIPQLRFEADLQANPWESWTFGAHLRFLDGIYASDQEKLSPGLDLGLAAEHRFGKRFSAWVRGDNLFNSSYERWAGYPQYGIRGMIGLRFRF